MNRILILGAGGHAAVLFDSLSLKPDLDVIGFCDIDIAKIGTNLFGFKVLDQKVLGADFSPTNVELVNGIGTVGVTDKRRMIFERYKGLGYSFATILHPSAVVGREVTIAEGAQLMAGAIVQPRSVIDADTIVNTRASVDHDCKIGKHVHLAPGCTLSGGVSVSDGAHIGTGVTIIEGISIGKGAMVAAGAVVVRDVPDHGQVAGVPARAMNSAHK